MKTAGVLVLVALLGACGDDDSTAAPDSAVHADSGPMVDSGTAVCDPFSNAGCLAGSKCTAVQVGTNLTLGCAAKGSKTQGMNCTPTATGDDCADGLACFSLLGDTTPTCRQFCISGAGTCPSGTGCGLVIKNPDNTMVGPFCRPVTTCLPLEQTPCVAGEGCYITSAGPECAIAGTKKPGEACSSANDCERGSSCLLNGGAGKCSFHCSTATAGTPACAATGTGGPTCTPPSGTPPEANFGVCR